MQAGIPFPNISPDIFSIEIGSFTFALRWYAMAYIVGIIIGWRMVVALLRRPLLWGREPPLTPVELEDLLTWIIIGVIAGGRLGYVLFYQPGYYLTHPLEIPMIWQGGMSFHGGFLGVLGGAGVFAMRRKSNWGSIMDALAVGTPPGLLLGRTANFINAELWGLPSAVPWAVIFPGSAAQDCPGVEGLCARHPSQLYEAALEGLLLGAVLLWLAYRRGWLRAPWALSGVFLTGYGLSRFIVEFFRQADAQYITAENPLGYVLRVGEAGLKMGQILSLPMLLAGIVMIVMAWRRA